MLVNGQNSDSLSVLDRGLLYGDGLFETIAFIDGKAPLWERHITRLEQGCRHLGIDTPDPELLSKEARSLVDSSPQVVKIIVTRGEGGAGYFPGEGVSTRILYRRPWPQRPAGPEKIHVCRTRLARGSATAGVKTLNRLEQVLAARETEQAGCREAILCDAAGYLVEGLMSNLFWVREGKLHTPRLDYCGVAGVMRGFVLETAKTSGIDVAIVEEKQDVLANADAIFLTNALGLRVVGQCDGNKYDPAAVPIEISAAINRLLKTE